MTDEFDDVRRYLRVKLQYYAKLMPEIFDDAIQEGMIQAWRDVEAGVEPRLKVLRRSAMTARRFLQRGGEHFYGKPAMSRDGVRRDRTTIEKVQVYLNETVGLRDAWPDPGDVSQALGIERKAVNVALKAIREGRIDHTVYWEDDKGNRRKDYRHYSEVPLEQFVLPESNGTKPKPWDENEYIAKYVDHDEFEEQVIAEADIIEILSRLNERHRTILYYYLFEGWNTGDIGRHLGYKTNPSQNGTRALNSALNQYKKQMNPYEGECRNGHKFSPETTKFQQHADGSWRRTCISCRKGK